MAITFAAAKTNKFIDRNWVRQRKAGRKNIRKVSQFSWKLKKASYLCTPLKRILGLTVKVKERKDELRVHKRLKLADREGTSVRGEAG
jgi:hypothetical protein